MMREPPSPPSFWNTVGLLLRASRKRAAGRRKRQRELLSSRAGKNATDWNRLGFAFTTLVMVVLNVAAAFVVRTAVSSGERFEVERQGKIVVSSWFLQAAKTAEIDSKEAAKVDDQLLDGNYYR